MFLNIQIDLLILKTYYRQFTTKKSLHIIFKSLKVIGIATIWQAMYHFLLVVCSNDSILPLFRDIYTFKVYVIACDLYFRKDSWNYKPLVIFNLL